MNEKRWWWRPLRAFRRTFPITLRCVAERNPDSGAWDAQRAAGSSAPACSRILVTIEITDPETVEAYQDDGCRMGIVVDDRVRPVCWHSEPQRVLTLDNGHKLRWPFDGKYTVRPNIKGHDDE